ncbi:biopolymer transporter [Leptolyngbya sp. FACHB-261]|uniref:TolB family protein n=1 Tax=Leptolyngbya sp. FACHB-261 TaxID=2692806 RepID=UPI001F557778|nr:biopolymer transporter [Leptolyngbya sp. FACHB-261]
MFTPPPEIGGAGINSQAPDESPSYSANGQYLAFASDRNASRDVFLYDVSNRRMLPLADLNRLDSSQDQPSISATARYIAYVTDERGRSDIWVYDRQQRTLDNLTLYLTGSVRHPTISADGRYVAFESNRLGQWHIELVDRGPDIELDQLPAPSTSP